IDLVAERANIRHFERQSGYYRDAVISLLTVQRDVLVAQTLEPLAGKRVVYALGLLQAQHVRPFRLDEFCDEVDAQPHRIDVPGCQGETHMRRLIQSPQQAQGATPASLRNSLDCGAGRLNFRLSRASSDTV